MIKLKNFLKNSLYFGFLLICAIVFQLHRIDSSAMPNAALTTFGIPFFIFLCFVLLIFSVWRRHWQGVFVLLFLAFHYNIHIQYTFPITNISKKSEEGESIRVMSFNAHFFNIDEYTINEPEVKQFLDELIAYDADILLLQEFKDFAREKGEEGWTAENHLVKAGYPYRYGRRSGSKKQRKSLGGSVIFSRFPLKNMRELDRKNKTHSNNSVAATALLPGITLDLISVHMHSMNISSDELQLTDANERENKLNNLRSKLTSGYEERGRQLEPLMDRIYSSPYPSLMAGDFNEIPQGNIHYRIRQKLNDAHASAGFGLGVTYEDRVPLLRIDYQWYDPKALQCVQLKVLREVKWSDHYPVLGTYKILRQAEG
ncbi:MAG: endonuclease/exonuclease/phosphatase family protein [Cyclobacteriaceae bacterium]|nr:endonuclease/exonuclease/phosphatase family protein [Cyclobacteriaceae bacterium]MCH8515845.1 endonuclease/exonuclease/phosphatase family protein [Cyclobacteriaceae bacterium]